MIKFSIYNDYYNMRDNVCINPGLNNNFVCQGIVVLEEHELILVSGYMSADTASRIYLTDKDNNFYYVTLRYKDKIFTGF